MNEQSIDVFLNAKQQTLTGQPTLADAIQHWQRQAMISGHFAAAINGDFVPRSQYHRQQLARGDSIDIVQPVGGG